jgi:hypothetical protein
MVYITHWCRCCVECLLSAEASVNQCTAMGRQHHSVHRMGMEGEGEAANGRVSRHTHKQRTSMTQPNTAMVGEQAHAYGPGPDPREREAPCDQYHPSQVIKNPIESDRVKSTKFLRVSKRFESLFQLLACQLMSIFWVTSCWSSPCGKFFWVTQKHPNLSLTAKLRSSPEAKTCLE